MAYRRKHNRTRSMTFEDHRPVSDESSFSPTTTTPPPPASAQEICTSGAHKNSSLSSACNDDISSCTSFQDQDRPKHSMETRAHEYTSLKNLHEPSSGFWDVLARKAKLILENTNVPPPPEEHHSQLDAFDSTSCQYQSNWSTNNCEKVENQTVQKGYDVIASKFDGTDKKSFEEGPTIVQNRINDIIQETKKLEIWRKFDRSDASFQSTDTSIDQVFTSFNQAEYETQLKTSRNVANAMVAKAKLLLRELKTIKADLAFTKERSTQLEEENKILRQNREKRNNPADDDLIRHQLETLLAEKARLLHENSMYARENRFLREIVEYHQLTMQDVVYVDEDNEEVTEAYTIQQFSTLPSPTRSESDVLSHTIPSCSPTPNGMLSPSRSALILLASPALHNSPPRTKIANVALDTELSLSSPKIRAPPQ